MPTGYTAGILEGKIKTFSEFAQVCMRAFGACIHMRDDNLDDEYTPAVPSNYHQDALIESQKELSKLSKISDEKLLKIHKNEILDEIKRYEKTIKACGEDKKILELILSDALKWTPPNDDYLHFKEFMIEQLTITIKHDADIEYYQERLNSLQEELQKLDIKEIREDRQKELEDSIEYHTVHHNEELTRVKNRNEWVRVLLESLKNSNENESKTTNI